METKIVNEIHVVQTITSLAKKLIRSELNPVKIKSLNGKLSSLGYYLGGNENQALIFTVIFALQIDDTHKLDMSDIARYLGVNYIDLLLYKVDIEHLIEKRLLKSLRERSISSVPLKNLTFSIPEPIMESIFMNQHLTIQAKETGLDVFKFVNLVSDLLDIRREGNMTTQDLWLEVCALEDENKELKMIKKIQILNLNIGERTMYYEICDDLIKGSLSGLDCTIRDIYDCMRDRINQIRNFKEKKNRLFELGMIKMNEAEFMTDATLELTSKGMDFFLEEDAALFAKTGDEKKMISPDKIAFKSLFYDPKLEQQVKFVEQSLQDDKFVTMQKRLEEMAMPKGVAAIFYGEPGTGKTETVYQLAKQTGRAIMHVDISQSKSMWFGESEKKIKEIFTNYKSLCMSESLKPILLFNEADAIFGKRKDNNASNVAQTENAIQNIILEEMEKLDGILIATTNLNQNLDTAFERRFLFKIKFEKPSVEAKQKIWKSKLDWLSEQEASALASDYSFSGGEIDNIVRKVIMEEVLNGVRPGVQEIIGYCDSEKFTNKAGSRRLGF